MCQGEMQYKICTFKGASFQKVARCREIQAEGRQDFPSIVDAALPGVVNTLFTVHITKSQRGKNSGMAITNCNQMRWMMLRQLGSSLVVHEMLVHYKYT